jgi:hypothetical protein
MTIRCAIEQQTEKNARAIKKLAEARTTIRYIAFRFNIC